MKNLMKVAATICLCLILWDGYGQSNVPSNDNIIENEFVCFSYDGGIHTTFAPNLLDLHNPTLTPNHAIKRSSLEDIMNENKENDQMMNIVGQTVTRIIEADVLAASKN